MLTCMMNSKSSKAVDIPRQLMFCSNFPSSGCLFLYNKTWNLLGDKTLQNHRRYFVFSYLSGKLSPKSKPRTHAHRKCSTKNDAKLLNSYMIWNDFKTVRLTQHNTVDFMYKYTPQSLTRGIVVKTINVTRLRTGYVSTKICDWMKDEEMSVLLV